MPNQEESNSILARIVAACLFCSCCKKPETLESNAIGSTQPSSSNLNEAQKPTPPLPQQTQSTYYYSKPGKSSSSSAPPPPIPDSAPPLVPESLSTPFAPPPVPESLSSQSAGQQSLIRVDSIDKQLNTIPDFLAIELDDVVKNKSIRFPDVIRPNSYKLKLIPNLDERKTVYWGSIEIIFAPTTNTKQITLDSSGHKIISVELKIIGARDNISVNYELKPNEKWLIIFADKLLIAYTDYKLTIVFDGHLSTIPFGFFLHTIVHETKTHQIYTKIATTQFEPEFAKLAFPCFDRINHRASFTLSIARLEDETTISNLRVIELAATNNDFRLDGRVWDTFESLENIPLYAVSFAIMNSEYQYIGTGADKPTGDDKVVAWAIPEVRDQVNYAIETAKFSVEFMEAITGVEFISEHTLFQLEMHIHLIQMQDTGKIDTMEEYQWNSILYTENNLLCYTDKCSELHIETVTLTVARKISYHWFGRFISSWSFPWLKNGFGKFFEFHLVDLMNPSWRIPELHGSVEMHLVMFADGRSVLNPITLPEPVSSGCVIQMYSFNNFEILNGKAALYLRMLEKIVGLSTFMGAVQKFVKFGNRSDGIVTANDLWNAFQTQIIEDNIIDNLNLPKNETIISIMNTWILWTGYPLITARSTLRADGKFTLFISQSQYHSISREPDDKRIIPITITTERETNFTNTTPVAWLKGTQMEIPINILQGEWYILNIQNSAYIRINYLDGNWERLIKRLCSVSLTDISAVNRAQLIADAHVLAIDGKISLNIPIIMISYLTREKDALVWLTAIRHFELMYFALSRNTRPKYKQHFLKILKIEYRRTGLDTNSNEDHLTKKWRRVMLAMLNMFEDEDSEKDAERKYERADDILSIDPNIQSMVFCTMVRKYEIKRLKDSQEVPAHVLLQRELTMINIVRQLRRLIIDSDEPCQKIIFQEALKCQQFWWKNPDYDMFKTLLENGKKMAADKFDEKMTAILSQWESIYHILQFIERMITEWRSIPPNRSDIKSLIQILRYLVHNVQGNPELDTLDRIIKLTNSFQGKMYSQLYDVLVYVRNTAKQGGKRILDEDGLLFPGNINQCVRYMNDRLKRANPQT